MDAMTSQNASSPTLSVPRTSARVRASELVGRGWLNTGGETVTLADLRGLDDGVGDEVAATGVVGLAVILGDLGGEIRHHVVGDLGLGGDVLVGHWATCLISKGTGCWAACG